MPTPRSSILTLLLGLAFGAAACAKGSGPTTEPPTSTAEPTPAEPVVRNVDAQPGDVTTCPYSGRTFVVKAGDPKVEHGGKTYWICSEQAAEAVRADPGKYLDDFQG